ncbi:unnamed protein product [Rangifer tarandus platyrhynchus]|uniref:Uncharacterized protein n=1 Tax=Rangifer tarandus platyrhynchus TaxID=3082113 RepID=A0AC59ZVE9_RANTA
MSVCIRPLHLDAVRCPGEPGWVQLSRGPAPRRDSRPPAPLLLLSRLLSPSPPQGLPLRLLHSRSSWWLRAAGRAGEPAPARPSGQRRGHGGSGQSRPPAQLLSLHSALLRRTPALSSRGTERPFVRALTARSWASPSPAHPARGSPAPDPGGRQHPPGSI